MKGQNRFSLKYAILTLALTAGVVAIALGSLPSTNPAGATLVRATAETWAGATQTNGAGATVAVVGASDKSVDSTNPLGATAFLGHLDPISTLAVGPGTQGWIAR